jgi:hypothetical protein
MCPLRKNQDYTPKDRKRNTSVLLLEVSNKWVALSEVLKILKAF